MRPMTRRTYGQRPAVVDPDADELPRLQPPAAEPVVRLAPWLRCESAGEGGAVAGERRSRYSEPGDSDPGR